jgi:outer membrane protein assembly factor BamD (BamD/ComL family)
MKRRKSEVNTRTIRARLFFFIVSTSLVVMTTSSCDGNERRAERLWRQAIACVEKGDTQGGVDHLQKIIDTFPDSRIAEKARAQIVVYRGLANAVENYPVRRARELMVQISRAIESFRRDNRRAPATLDDLVPAKLASIPNDPWDRPFLYETTARGYRLRCLGVSGAPQGSAAATGLLVVDGEFRTVSP